MNHILVAPNTTWCPDTPANWKRFQALKEAIQGGTRSKLEGQIQKENKRLAQLRTYLPGYEPDRLTG